MKISKKKILIAAFIILICIFIVVRYISKKNTHLVQVLDVNNELVVNLIDDTMKIDYTKEDIYDKSYNIKDVNTKDLLSISLKELDKQSKIHYCTVPSTFTLEELNDSIKNPNIKKRLTKEAIEKLVGKETIYLSENEFFSLKIIDDKYEISTVCGYTDPFNEVIKYNIVNASRKDNEITIDVTVAFGKIDELNDVDDYSYNYYKDYEYKKHKETLEYDENIDTNLYNVYTFKYDIDDEQGYLKSVKLN